MKLVMTTETETPRIVKALRFFGWFSIIGFPIIAFGIAGSTNMGDAPGVALIIGALIAGILSGTVFFGFAAIIMKLYEIESHVSHIRKNSSDLKSQD